MIVTIGGNIGAGKTVLAGKLAAALGYEELYMGGIFRQMAAEKGVSIEQFYRALRENPAVEREADARQAELMRMHDNLIVQGRISWHFATGSPFRIFNIFLKVEPSVGAERSGARDENSGKPISELAKANAEREAQERERYRALYSIEDYHAPEHYDFILDTSRLTEAEVFEKVLTEIHEKQRVSIPDKNGPL